MITVANLYDAHETRKIDKMPIIRANIDHDTMLKVRDFDYCNHTHIVINDNGMYDVYWTVIHPDYTDPFIMGNRLNDAASLAIYNCWVAPNGDIYPVYWCGHNCFAHVFRNTTQDAMENIGWLHFSFARVANSWQEDEFSADQCFTVAMIYDALGMTALADRWNRLTSNRRSK
jgi:hypothetical protein